MERRWITLVLLNSTLPFFPQTLNTSLQFHSAKSCFLSELLGISCWEFWNFGSWDCLSCLMFWPAPLDLLTNDSSFLCFDLARVSTDLVLHFGLLSLHLDDTISCIVSLVMESSGELVSKKVTALPPTVAKQLTPETLSVNVKSTSPSRKHHHSNSYTQFLICTRTSTFI